MRLSRILRLMPLLALGAFEQGCLCSLTTSSEHTDRDSTDVRTSYDCLKKEDPNLPDVVTVGLEATPASLTLFAGQTATTSVKLLTTGSSAPTSSTIRVDQLSGASAVLSNNTVTTSSPVTLSVTATTDQTMLPNNGPVVLTPTTPEGIMASATDIMLTIDKAFDVVAEPNVTVNAGGTVDIPLTIRRAVGFGGAVTLGLEGLLANATPTFDEPTTTSASTTLHLSVPSDAATQPDTVRLTGQSGLLRDDALIILNVTPPIDGLTLSASPSTVVAARNGSGTSQIALVRSGSVGAVTLDATGLPNGVTFTPVVVPATTSSTDITLAVGPGVADGTYPFTMRGTAGAITSTVPMTLRVVAGFSLSAVPVTMTLATGSFETTRIDIARESAAVGAVTLSTTGLPTGATSSFSDQPAAGNSSTLTITAGTAVPGTYSVTVSGTANDLTRRIVVTVTIVPAPFTLAANPTPIAVDVGSSATTTVSIARPAGPINVALAVTAGLPLEATATFSPPATASASSFLTITTTRNTPPGTYMLTVRGIGAGIPWSFALPLVVSAVPDFAIAVSPATQSMFAPGTATVAVTILRTAGFSGTVTFTSASVPATVTASIAPGSVSGTQGAVLTITATAQAQPGDYIFSVVGTSGSVTRRASVVVTVTQYIPPLGGAARAPGRKPPSGTP